jgi:hypothetical protein
MREDGGAMLVIALIIITTVALVTGAVLAHGGTNIRATVNLRAVAGTSYAADAAAKVAVNDLRLGSDAPGWATPTFPGPWADWVYTNNADGTGCFGAVGTAPDNTLELNGFYPKAGDQSADSSARVECAVVPGTGIFAPGSGVGIEDPSPTDAYARALTTIGTTGTRQGMTLKPLGTGNTAAMPFRGGVASKSYIDAQSGALVTDGYVKAEGNCIGVIVSNPPKECNSPGSVPIPATPDSPLTAVPAFQDASTTGCTFEEGYYNNAAALTAAVDACTVAHFLPGKYYFDFRDEERGTGQNVWHIAKTVIGGVRAAGNPTSIPGTCLSPILNDPVAGVQFVFGGTSRITVGDTAHVELCGPSNGGEPPMTVYQQPTGTTNAPVPLPAQPAQNVDLITGGQVDRFTVGGANATAAQIQAALQAADGSTSNWVASNNNRRAEIDLRNFNGLSTIPVGADITSAQVRIKYARSPLTPNLAIDVTGTPASPAVTVPAPDASGWATLDLADHLRSLIVSGGFNATRPKLELRLPATPKDQTLTIDTLTLAVTYVAPSLRAATDVDFVYSPGGNFHGEFIVQGATWAPKGYVDIDPGSFDSALVAFRWGLVALGVDFKAQPSQTFGYPLVSIPDAGTGLGNKVTVVDLKVYVCVEQGTCDSGGTHALTVRVMITDPPYSSWGGGPARPEPGRRKIEVLSWSEQR